MKPAVLLLAVLLVPVAMAIESAPYTVEQHEGRWEIRRYPALLVAETAMGRDDNGSFMRLFRYIDGGNASREKIAMTTPVFMEPGRPAGRMAFVLPESVAASAAPVPSSPDVRLRQTEPMRVAAWRFSGLRTERNSGEAREALLAAVRERGLVPEGEVFFAYYNSPWTPGFMRRNEALVRLAEPTAAP